MNSSSVARLVSVKPSLAFGETHEPTNLSAYRLQKVNELIKAELGKILLRELEERPGGLVTIIQVETAKDLENAGVFVSVYPSQDAKAVSNELGRKVGWLQHLLNTQLRMRPVPKIRFALDDKLNEADRVEQLIQKTQKR